MSAVDPALGSAIRAARSLHRHRELHLRVYAAQHGEAALLRKRHDGSAARCLLAGIEGEVGMIEIGVVDEFAVGVDDLDALAGLQRDRSGGEGTALLGDALRCQVARGHGHGSRQQERGHEAAQGKMPSHSAARVRHACPRLEGGAPALTRPAT